MPEILHIDALAQRCLNFSVSSFIQRGNSRQGRSQADVFSRMYQDKGEYDFPVHRFSHEQRANGIRLKKKIFFEGMERHRMYRISQAEG